MQDWQEQILEREGFNKQEQLKTNDMKTRIEIEIQYLQNEIESIKDSIKESLDMNFFNVAHNKVQRIQELTEKIFELRTLLNS